jgi:hypothetical protein
MRSPTLKLVIVLCVIWYMSNIIDYASNVNGLSKNSF